MGRITQALTVLTALDDPGSSLPGRHTVSVFVRRSGVYPATIFATGAYRRLFTQGRWLISRRGEYDVEVRQGAVEHGGTHRQPVLLRVERLRGSEARAKAADLERRLRDEPAFVANLPFDPAFVGRRV